MLKKIFFTALTLLLCSSCVSRTTYKGSDLSGSNKTISGKKLVWFWDKDF